MNIGPFDSLIYWSGSRSEVNTASNFEAAKPVAVLGIERAVRKLKRLQVILGIAALD